MKIAKEDINYITMKYLIMTNGKYDHYFFEYKDFGIFMYTNYLEINDYRNMHHSTKTCEYCDVDGLRDKLYSLMLNGLLNDN